MKSIKTRIISFILCLAFTLTVWPLATFAESIENVEEAADILYDFFKTEFYDEQTADSAENDEIYLDFVVAGEEPDGVELGYPKAIITSTNLNIYANQFYNSVGVNVGDASGEEIELLESFTYSNGAVIYFFSYRGTTNSALKEAAVDYQFISAQDIVIDGSTEEQPEEVLNCFDFILQSGLLEDFEEAYENAQNSGFLDYFTSEQLSEIDSIRATLEQMAANTADWTEMEVTGNVSTNGVYVYRNPVTRPNDYVVANKLKPITDDENIESIDFTSANIIGKYSDVSGNAYFILDTDNWSVFDGVVPYRFIKQEDIIISEKNKAIYKDAGFVADTIKLYTNCSTGSDYVEITDGLSRGVFEAMYEIVIVDKTGSMTTWYWLNTDGWKDSNGNDISTSYYVKAEDVYLVTSMTDTTGVSVMGDIPAGSNLYVSSVANTETGMADGIYVVGENSLFYNVTLLDSNGSETQPGAGGITVTFPESSVLSSGLEVGDKYHVYHVHDGIVDMSEAQIYNGGNVEMFFNSLSVVGLSETAFTKDFITDNGEILDESCEVYPTGEELSATIKTDENGRITIYNYHENNADGMQVEGTNGYVVSLAEKIVYSNGYILYRFYYDGADVDFSNVISDGGYRFIPSEYVIIGEISSYDKIYNDLLLSETIDDWNAVVDLMTEEEYENFINSLTEEQQIKLDNLFASLPTYYDKLVSDSYENIISSTSFDEFINLRDSLPAEIITDFTFEQIVQIVLHRLELLINENRVQPEDYELPGGPEEPFVTPAALATYNNVTATYAALQPSTYARMLLADTAPVVPIDSSVTTDTSGNLVMKKSAATNADGSYTVTLETYVKGEVTVVTSAVPVDITLVLDVSGSMDFCLVCGEEITDNNNTHDDPDAKVNYENYTYSQYTYSANKEYYYQNSSGEYVRVYYCTSGNNSHRGWYTNQHSQNNHGTRITSQIYEKSVAQEACTPRMSSLQEAVKDFITSTNNQNSSITDPTKKHRIAIVKFASDSTNDIGNETYYDSTYRYYPNYSQVVQGFEIVSNDNIETMKSTIDSFVAEGATRTDYGLNHAYRLISALPEAERTARKQVVIVFTDGTPTTAQGFEDAVANNALASAAQIKDLNNTTIYTISVANGSKVDAGNDIPAYVAPGSNENNIQLMNRFMHMMSSNNPDAADIVNGPLVTETATVKATGRYNSDSQQWESFYLVPSNKAELNAIFQQISEGLNGGSDMDLDSSAKVEDIVSPYFNIPENASGITVTTVNAGAPENGEPTWDESSATTITEGISYDPKTRTLDVTNFDFAGNFVSDTGRDKDKYLADKETIEPGTYYGQKLVITFNVEPNAFFLGGNNVITNTAAIVENSSGDPVGEFYQPKVDVSIKDIDIKWQNQHIYVTNNADIAELFKNATVTSRDGKSTSPLATVLDGVNNAYVDIVFTIKDPNGNSVGTYTVKAGKKLSEGSWNQEATLTPTPLVDSPYSLTWTITPSESGDAETINHTEPETATVYVFKPELTFQDHTVDYDSVINGTSYDSNSSSYKYETQNYVSTVWKNDTVGSVSNTKTGDITINDSFADKSAKMSGTVPTLTFTYAPSSGVTDGKVSATDYVAVNVTVKVDGTPITDNCTFIHRHDENSPSCSEWKTEFSGGQPAFLLHVINAVGQLKIIKTGLNQKTHATTDSYWDQESAIFTVTEHEDYDGDGKIDFFTVVIIADESGYGEVTISNLKHGRTYIISEDSGWTWRYETTFTNGNQATIKGNETVEVKVKNTHEKDKWLDGSTWAVNVFGSTSGTYYDPNNKTGINVSPN